jgi:hypothetical protein
MKGLIAKELPMAVKAKLDTFLLYKVITEEQHKMIIHAFYTGENKEQAAQLFNEAAIKFLSGSIITLNVLSNGLIDILDSIKAFDEFYRHELKQTGERFITQMSKSFTAYHKKFSHDMTDEVAKLTEIFQEKLLNLPQMSYVQWVELIQAIDGLQKGQVDLTIDYEEVVELRAVKEKLQTLQTAIDDKIAEKRKMSMKPNLDANQFYRLEGEIDGLTQAKIHLGLQKTIKK